ncbi:solute carrier family 22 member 5-like [Lingula anatina]|uniref:Solute carrier family 22 member 5-like n=1 Tax=Lingula anatina TaxID=7574 RepID=A0A1S3JLJ0_LINAN|nr:solute carrier family 22 member 5-like [Lingula anatina]|eukprot:XP_013411248.1 solute carrier family 22 member 5-like [Lingula anatina]
MHLDELLHIIGEFGTFQKRQYFLVCLVGLYTAFPILSSVFLAATPKHNCKIPAEYVSSAERVYGNLSREELLNLTIPWEEKDGKQGRSSCKLKSWDRNGSYYEVPIAADDGDNKTASVECPSGREYSQEIYISTAVSEFDLGCGREWLVSTSQSVFFAGKLVGDALSGIISDRFGRRPTFLVAIMLSVSFGILTALSPNMIVFIVSLGLQGLVNGCLFLTVFTLGRIPTEKEAAREREVLCIPLIVCHLYCLSYINNSVNFG